MKETNKSLLSGLAVILGLVVIVALAGLVAIHPQKEILMGEVDASEYRVSNKVPGRIDQIYVHEGDMVKAGDTLAHINSPQIDAKMMQATAVRSAASAQSQKAQHGAREQQIQMAYQVWQKAKAAVEVYGKSYDRVKGLYEKGVVSAQKFDEAEAMYKSAQAQVKAAKSQYDMAVNGARQEERRAASATVGQARGAVQEVEGYVRETVQVAQMDGEVTDVYPKVGELVGTGTPIMSIAVMDDQWATFNIREDQLKDIKVGNEISVRIPALDKETKMKVTSIKDKGSFAVWKATKASGQYDQKTFEVKALPTVKIDDIRPGMSVILKK